MARIGEATAPVATREALARARMRAALVPDLLIDARRIVSTVIAHTSSMSEDGYGTGGPLQNGCAFSK